MLIDDILVLWLILHRSNSIYRTGGKLGVFHTVSSRTHTWNHKVKTHHKHSQITRTATAAHWIHGFPDTKQSRARAAKITCRRPSKCRTWAASASGLSLLAVKDCLAREMLEVVVDATGIWRHAFWLLATRSASVPVLVHYIGSHVTLPDL